MMDTPLTGQLIGSRYRVAEILGAGGMGVVYRAVDEQLGRDVALKVLPKELQQNAERLRRFTNEARAASLLNHPNVLTVHEVGEVNGAPFIAMELVDGETLRHRLSKGPMPLIDALELALQIAAGLAAAHDKGVIHRDVKPENVMIRRDGFAKVVDFGLATLRPAGGDVSMMTTGAFEPTGATVVGTLAYMSPEQIDGQPIDRRSDVLSFGVVLCEIAAGINPFARPTVLETLNAIAQTPASAASAMAAIPPVLAPIVRKALERRPADRYQSMADVIVDLRRARRQLNDGDGVGRVFSDSQATPQGRSRYRMLFAGAVVMLAAAIAGGVYFVTSRAAGVRIESIAVLPFVNGGNADIEYLSQGMARHIVNTLAALDADLRVVPWSAVSTRYTGKDPQEVGRTLRVDAVVTGIVTQRSDSLDIQIELIDITREAQIWGRQYRPKLVDVLTAENQMARDVADRLRLDSSLVPPERLSRRDTDNPQAHLLYLKGRNLTEKLTVKEALQAVQYFQQAITLDPHYVAAYAGLSSASAIVAIAFGPTHESAVQARAAADKALALDNSSAEAHYALGRVYQLDWKWTDAERELKAAASLNPTLVDAHHYLSHILSALGRHEESLTATMRALEVDPLDPLMNAHRAWLDLHSGHVEAAIAGATKSLRLGETYFAHLYLARAYAQAGRYDEALSEMRRAQEMSPANPAEALANVGYVYAKSGRAREARLILDEMDRLSKQREIPLGLKAFVHVGLDEKNVTFTWLEHAFGERTGFLRDLKIDERWVPLRSDARYVELVERIGLSGPPISAGQAAALPR